VNRDYLFKHKDTVRKVMQSYLRTAYEHSTQMDALIKADALAAGDALSDDQVTNLVQGIWWKNVQENYAHMGLQRGHSLQHIEDIIGQIVDVLKKTDSSFSDPTGGHFEKLYYNDLLADLQKNSFHPGRTMDSTGQIRSEVALKELDDSGWKKLEPIGTLQIPTIQFARGTSILTNSSKQVLDELVKNLETWPTYYVSVIGNASARGDAEANKVLAESRAKAAADYITSKGISPIRLRAVGSMPGSGSSVAFVLGQLPY
jgi:outer membrane protein OmpA-like peptidoglycan-associated protein